MKTTSDKAMDTGIVPIQGGLSIDDDVIGSIAAMAATNVEGVVSLGTSSFKKVLAERVKRKQRKSRGIEVAAGLKEAILDIDLKVFYGYSIQNVVREVRFSVATKILELTGLNAKEINIYVIGVDLKNSLSNEIK
ncbi:uncharacterized protein METZ01_LOCUS124478 [marine metagenome]|uniref:Asp23/Gls24 family envelope stress response protein n=1 Tax=marine metagenome TaxID=408172 RepID=A0A381Y3M9_9ZZZZ